MPSVAVKSCWETNNSGVSRWYLNSLDHEVNGRPELNVRLVRYADDFVLLCRRGTGLRTGSERNT